MHKTMRHQQKSASTPEGHSPKALYWMPNMPLMRVCTVRNVVRVVTQHRYGGEGAMQGAAGVDGVYCPMMVGSAPYWMPVTVLTRVSTVRMWFL